MNDDQLQLKQLSERTAALRITLDSMEAAGATVPAIHAAKDRLADCEKLARYAVETKKEIKYGHQK